MASDNIRQAAPLATFPDGYIQVPKLTAPTAAEAVLITQYNSALAQGDTTTAESILANNPNLNNCRISVNNYNTIIDELKAIEMFYNEEVQDVLDTATAQAAGINDSTPSNVSAYSSNKVDELVSEVNDSVSTLERRINKMNNIQTIKFDKNASWTGSGPYTQSKNISGYGGDAVISTDRPETFYNSEHLSTAADMEAYDEQCGYISKIETGNGVLIATAYERPTMDIYVDVKGV